MLQFINSCAIIILKKKEEKNMKFSAEPKDWAMFGAFCLLLLYMFAIWRVRIFQV